MLCHRAKVAKALGCCSYRLCSLQYNWWKQIPHRKAINFNEARGISEGHQTLFFLMRGCGLGTTLTVMVGHYSLILRNCQSEF